MTDFYALGRLVAIGAFSGLFVAGAAVGADYWAKHVAAEDGNIKCIWARERLITVISGPCEKFGKPHAVRLGETFSANGKVRTISVIEATEMEKDMPSIGLRKGDWTCVAAESPADIPGLSKKDDHTGTWLYIAKCKPLE